MNQLLTKIQISQTNARLVLTQKWYLQFDFNINDTSTNYPLPQFIMYKESFMKPRSIQHIFIHKVALIK